MYLVDLLYEWTGNVLLWGTFALFVWAIIDCSARRTAAFTAVNKLTKPAWLAILVISGGLGSLLGYQSGTPVNLVTLVAVIVTLVYLADVRPAVREISGGR